MPKAYWIVRVSVRDQTSRWGSCTAAGVLSYSWRLILGPPHVLDYVAAHEVAGRGEDGRRHGGGPDRSGEDGHDRGAGPPHPGCHPGHRLRRPPRQAPGPRRRRHEGALLSNSATKQPLEGTSAILAMLEGWPGKDTNAH